MNGSNPPRIAAFTLLLVCATGCDFILGKELNPAYCQAHPSDSDCRDKYPDAAVDGGACTTNTQCTSPTGICDQTRMSCVQCTSTEAQACTGTTPACGADDTCRGCTAHAECSSNACLPDGSCGTDASVAYVDPGGTDNASCTKQIPCTKVTKALATNRTYVKFHGTTNEQVSINNTNTTLLADPGAKLTSTSNGILLEVRGSSQVRIYDLEVSGGSGPSGNGISMPLGNTASVTLTRVTVSNNSAGGIVASGGSLTILRSTIAANQGGGISASGGAVAVLQTTVTSNPGGGISVTGAGGTFDIRNSFVYRNGSVSGGGSSGGINVAGSNAASNRLEFNTIVDNNAPPGATHAGGVFCDIAGFAAPNNIVARNSVGLSTTDVNSQTLGLCAYPTSTIANDTSGLVFIHADTAPFDYHLMQGSSAIDAATTTTTTVIDFDGDSRPQGAANDRGADEVKP